MIVTVHQLMKRIVVRLPMAMELAIVVLLKKVTQLRIVQKTITLTQLILQIQIIQVEVEGQLI